MSFYPAEHYTVGDDGSTQDWQNYTTTQPPQTVSPSHTTDEKFSVQDASYPYPMSGPSSQDPYPSSQPMTWPAAEAQGLGFDSLQTPTQSIFNNTSSNPLTSNISTPNVSTLNISGPWPIAVSHFIPNSHPESTYGQARFEQFYPTASALTDNSQWKPLQQVPFSAAPVYEGPAYHTSPAQSEHSASSYSSLIASSPYAQSDGYFHTASSPQIKVEDSFDQSHRNIYSTPGTPQYERQSHIDPNDLLMPPASSAAAAQQTKNEHDDFEYEQSLLRAAPATEQPDASGSSMSEAERGAEHGARFRRGFTTTETSTCTCPLCGMLFQRSYNLKAHMATHDPHREQPNGCGYTGCKRRFVRRTDLLRHEQSVHLRARNFVCTMCGSGFARKDTLRRHAEDGCSYRPAEARKRVDRRRSSDASTSRARHR